MPKDSKNKKRKQESSESDSDSGPEDRGPAKRKPVSTPKPGSKKQDEEPCFQLDKMKFIKVREFKGKTYIDIREYYEKDGDLLPGKKGISLSVDQYNKMKAVLSDVDEALSKL